jgi:hypothetical protein
MQKLKTKVRQAIKGYNPQEMFDYTMREGGSTARKGMLGGMKHQKYQKGYQVALGRQYERAVNPNPSEFTKAYQDAQKQVGRKDLGTWLDKDINKIVIEPSQVLSNKDRALKIGRQRKQKAVWGFKEKQEFPTGYKGK